MEPQLLLFLSQKLRASLSTDCRVSASTGRKLARFQVVEGSPGSSGCATVYRRGQPTARKAILSCGL